MMLVGLSACSKDEAASANSQLDATQADLDAANTKNSELQSSLDDSQATASSLAADGAATQAKNDELTASLATETKRADDAEAQIAAAVGKFPVTVTASTDEFNVIGTYNMTFTEAFCQGVPACGTPRPVVNARIIQGSNGLEIDVPTVFTTGLLDVKGNLIAGTDSDQILVCNGAPRNARVLVTIFVNAVTIDQTGAKTLQSLGASVFIENHDTSQGCPDVSVFYGAQMVPAA
jgi:hypothetical protein